MHVARPLFISLEDLAMPAMVYDSETPKRLAYKLTGHHMNAPAACQHCGRLDGWTPYLRDGEEFPLGYACVCGQRFVSGDRVAKRELANPDLQALLDEISAYFEDACTKLYNSGDWRMANRARRLAEWIGGGGE